MVISTRGSSGRLGSRSEPPYIGGDNLTPQKAQILLMFALTVTRDRAEIPARIRRVLGRLTWLAGRRIDSRKPAIWFQLRMLRDAQFPQLFLL